MFEKYEEVNLFKHKVKSRYERIIAATSIKSNSNEPTIRAPLIIKFHTTFTLACKWTLHQLLKSTHKLSSGSARRKTILTRAFVSSRRTRYGEYSSINSAVTMCRRIFLVLDNEASTAELPIVLASKLGQRVRYQKDYRWNYIAPWPRAQFRVLCLFLRNLCIVSCVSILCFRGIPSLLSFPLVPRCGLTYGKQNNRAGRSPAHRRGINLRKIRHRASNRMGATEGSARNRDSSSLFLRISVPVLPCIRFFHFTVAKATYVCIWVIQLPAGNTFIDGIYFSSPWLYGASIFAALYVSRANNDHHRWERSFHVLVTFPIDGSPLKLGKREKVYDERSAASSRE